MLKNGYIQNTVNKSEKFSDQCYYICGDGSKMKTASADRLQTDMQGMLCAVRHARYVVLFDMQAVHVVLNNSALIVW